MASRDLQGMDHLTRATEGRLRGWKDIGRWFGVDERTVKRWESYRGLPIHRLPGQPRAPVFAYEDELRAWLDSDRAGGDGGEAASEAGVEAGKLSRAGPVSAVRRRPVLLWLLLLVLAAAGGWFAWQAGAERRAAEARGEEVRQLALSQISEVSDQLERQPGTVRLRAALASRAAALLAGVADRPDATAELKQEAAEAYRRLATVQNASDRPSLRNRPAARASLDSALKLLEGDETPAGRALKARILAKMARHAAASGQVAKAPAMLAEADRLVPGPDRALAEELALARAEVASWQGAYAETRKQAARVSQQPAADPDSAMRQLRALDLSAESHFYGGDLTAALNLYLAAEQASLAAVRRWPGEPRFRWALQRQQWNVGGTLVDLGRPQQAVERLRTSHAGWLKMAKADPEDGSVASWVRITRISLGSALAVAGQFDEAIRALSQSVAERRVWLAEKPTDPERQRALVVGLNGLGDALALAGRTGEACALYAESSGRVSVMDKAGSLTALDRGSIVRQLQHNSGRWCAAKG